MSQKKTWSEELEIAGKDLLQTLDTLIKEGTTQRVVLRNKQGHVLLEVPLAATPAASGAAVLMICLLYTSPSPRD